MSEALVDPLAPLVPLPSLSTDVAPLSLALDRITHDERVHWMAGLGGRELRALYDLAKGTSMSVADLAGPAAADGPGHVVIGEGKNSMLLFNRFQKRFARMGDQIVGYNHNNAFAMWWVGPGHFFAYDSPEVPGEVWIDYRALPHAQHPSFPPLITNDRGLLPRFTYGGMYDILRRVSRDLFIGISVRRLPPKALFALVRVPG
jgi:hypothetical protein